jgi:two-component system cell cycle response regulator
MTTIGDADTGSCSENGAPRDLRQLQVLVVDDDDAARVTLTEAVRALGHLCRSASDGIEAWQLHQADPAQVILSDWKMPGMNGLELCRTMREASLPGQYTQFILVTGLSDKERFLEGMAAGADDYITKPVDIDELEVRLRAACRAARAHETLEAVNRQLQRESERCLAVARTDPLTQAASRLHLQSDLEAIVDRAIRYGHRYCAAFCDIDGFKSYNDTYGHLRGDDAIRIVSGAIQAQLRKGDGFYRYGGDEFLVLLPEQYLQGALECMERVRLAVASLPDVTLGGPLERAVTISIGIAELILTPDVDVITSWLSRADAALYQAKARGRNRIEIETAEIGGAVGEGAGSDVRALVAARRSSRPPRADCGESRGH